LCSVSTLYRGSSLRFHPPTSVGFGAYLNKIRKLTFGFRLALVRQKARKGYADNPTPETMGEILGRSAGEMQRIGRIYRFL